MKKRCFFFIFGLVALLACDDKGNAFDEVARFNADVKKIDDFLEATGAIAVKDNSGVRVVITDLGAEGLPPTRDQRVSFDFKGALFSTGSVFEEGTAEGVLHNSMPGLVEGLEILPEGSKAKLYIPSTMGFGNIDRTGVPANSILVYEVDLTNVILSNEEKQQFTADTAAINKYLKDNNIEAVSAPFGITYTINEEGSGTIPGWFSQIKVNYRSSVLGSQEAFFNGTVQPNQNFDSRVVDFLPGLMVAFQSFPPGTKATVYIPSTYAFGIKGVDEGRVPANSNVVYEINSFEVVKY